MAKQIKLIKCPQCGNTKPRPIGSDHYRCDKCGTEFFLDNDDLNINVNHKYETDKTDILDRNKSILIIVASFIFIFFVFGINMCSHIFNSVTGSDLSELTVNMNEYKESYNATLLISVDNKAVLFYQTYRDYIHRTGDDRRQDMFVFRDVKSGKIIKEYTEKVKRDSYVRMQGRLFQSDSSYYFTVSNSSIYQIKPGKYTIEDITDDICSRKPALNTGLSAAYILDWVQGDGFRLVTNLGKELYYFPKTNSLYTEKAFKYMADGGMETLTPEATDRVYYLFDKNESKSSSSVISIIEVKYKFNNGEPQNLRKYPGSYILDNLGRYRITSYKPLTEEFIAFEPNLLFRDKNYMIISFNATMAEDTPSKVQLMTTKGEVLWTVTFDTELKCKGAVRTDCGFMLQTDTDKFCEISFDGQTKTDYAFPEMN